MKTGAAILAGLLAGVLVAGGILAAFVFVGPNPVGLHPTPSPTDAVSATPSAPVVSPSASAIPSPSASSIPSIGPSASPSASNPAGSGASPAGTDAAQTGFHVGQAAPALVVPQLGGGTIDLSTMRGKAVWVNFMQTTCADCVAEFPLMNGFEARNSDKGLIVVAVDIREDEGTVASFATRLNTRFPIGLDADGAAQRAWATYALPIHFWIDRTGIVRAGALGGIGRDVMAANLAKILPGVNVTP